MKQIILKQTRVRNLNIQIIKKEEIKFQVPLVQSDNLRLFKKKKQKEQAQMRLRKRRKRNQQYEQEDNFVRVKKDFAEYDRKRDRMKLYHNEFKKQNQDVAFEQYQMQQAAAASSRSTKSNRNFDQFAQNFYPNRFEGSGGTQEQYKGQKYNHLFENQYIKQQQQYNQKPVKGNYQEFLEEGREEWEAKPTKEGFLYFHMVGTNTYQWNFPRYYDPQIKKTRSYFIDKWVKCYDDKGKKYWQNYETKNIQFVKPDCETYLIQAAILGNLAFLEVYIKHRGSLAITDQQQRNALHHAVSNGHKQLSILLCEFGSLDNLLEGEDLNGCTPIYGAVRYNEHECVKVLLSYQCDMMHKKKNGDTCLHEAAAFNSLDCMVVLSSFGGLELFQLRNRQGLRAIDIAEKMGNYECFQALQKLERNLGMQTAILEREISHAQSKRGKRNKIAPMSERLKPSNNMVNQRRRLNVIEEENSQYSSNSQEDSEIGHLGGRDRVNLKMLKYEEQQRASDHMRDYMQQIKKEKKMRPTKRTSNNDDVPDYREYKIQKKKSTKRIKRSQQQSDSSSSEVYETHQSKSISRVKNLSSRQTQQFEEENYHPNLPLNDKSRSYLKLSIRDDSIMNSKIRQIKAARDVYVLDNKQSQDDESEEDDDEEKGRSQNRKKAKTERKKKKKQDDRVSIVEKAFDKTSTIVKGIAWFMKDKIVKLKDYVWQDENENKESESSYDTPRGNSKSRSKSRKKSRSKSKTAREIRKIQPLMVETTESNTSYAQEEPQYPRKGIPKRQQVINSQRNKQMMLESFQQQIMSEENKSHSIQFKEKKSISIQADKEYIEDTKKKNHNMIKRRDSLVSTKSVGVGSINVNESQNHTHTNSSQTHSSKQAQQSRMIQLERKKRLGNKSKQMIQKTYQSSEDERKKIIRSPSPAPRFMKEEIQQIKLLEIAKNPIEMANAFQPIDRKTQEEENIQQSLQQQKQEINNQVKDLFTNNQRELLKKSSSQNIQSMVVNQRYQRQLEGSPSSLDVESRSQSPFTNQVQSQQINQNVLVNPYQQNTSQKNFKPVNLISQQQYDILMLNSNDDKSARNANNNYKIDDNEVLDQQKQGGEKKQVTKDIKKFYDDLLKNTSITQIDALGAQNQSQTINESNISELYNKIMNPQKKSPQQQDSGQKSNSKNNSKDEKIKTPIITTKESSSNHIQIKEELKQDISLEIPNDLQQWPEQSINYYEIEEQTISLLQDMNDLDMISNSSFLKNEVIQKSYQSNFLDKGQFLMNSCNSTYNQKQNLSIQRPLGGMLLQNNSMQNFNIQYQSDNEGDYAPMKKLENTPQKKRNLIPPININNILTRSQNKTFTKSQFDNQNDESAQSGVQQNTQEQKMMINLFKEDAEVENLIKPTNLAEELKEQRNNNELQLLNQSNSNSILMEDQIQVQFIESSDAQNDIFRNMQDRPQEYNQETVISVNKKSNVLILSNDTKTINTKNQKKNKRYEQEDSLINFDLSSSKIGSDKGLDSERNKNQDQNKIQHQDEDESLPQNLISQSETQTIIEMVENKQTAIKRQQSVVQYPIIGKIEASVLPLQLLKAAYIQKEIQNWEGESHSLVNENDFKKALLGNMMAQAFQGSANSDLKLIKRNYIPYQGGEAFTKFQARETAAAASGNQKIRQLKEENKVEKWPATNLSQNPLTNQSASQDSILQDLDTISRIYYDLETVQEEDGTQNEKTEDQKQQMNTESRMENSFQFESPNQSMKQHRVIPKKETKQNVPNSSMKPESQQQSSDDPTINLFYHGKFSDKRNSLGSSSGIDPYGNNNDQEEMINPLAPNYYNWKKDEKQNRSTAMALLYNLQTSSEDESKRKSGFLSKAKPKNKLLHTSVNAPLYQQIQPKKTVKDVSYKSQNISTNTDRSERLRENLKLFQQNKLIRNNSKEKLSTEEKKE